MTFDPSTVNDITRSILGGAIEVHRTVGPGLLESTYLDCLEYELGRLDLRFERQRLVPIVYKGIPLSASYRIDLIVEDLVVVEVKSVRALAPVHWAQVLTYLRLTECPVGLLINFNVARLMDGVKRVLNSRASRGGSNEPWPGTGPGDDPQADAETPEKTVITSGHRGVVGDGG
jgi:GxxExxY protein